MIGNGNTPSPLARPKPPGEWLRKNIVLYGLLPSLLLLPQGYPAGCHAQNLGHQRGHSDYSAGRADIREPIRKNALQLLFLFLAQALERHHAFVLGGVEHDHALRRAPGDADAGHRRADQLAGIGDEHHLVRLLHRE
jgi:hypothetical protein